MDIVLGQVLEGCIIVVLAVFTARISDHITTVLGEVVWLVVAINKLLLREG